MKQNEPDGVPASLRRSVQSLFPAGAVADVFPVWVPEADPPGYPQEMEAVATAGPTRRRQYLSGRHAAHTVLEQLGGPSVPLLNASSGAVLWPDGWTGSISHTASWCVAVAARICEWRGVGIDLEASGRMTEPVARRILLPEEVEWISQSGMDSLRMAALLFSAKEALYKAAAPVLKRFIAFREVQLLPERMPDGWLFRARMPQSGEDESAWAGHLIGRGLFCDDWCLAGFRVAP